MEGKDTVIYFAYGSNMLERRLKGRTPSAIPVGVGKLMDKKVLMNKRNADGSGKANLVDSPGSVAYGVLFLIDRSELPDLDRIEGGYDRHMVEIYHGEATVEALTYISQNMTDEPVAFDWYRAIILEGAREHRLREDYIAYLRNLPYKAGKRRGG